MQIYLIVWDISYSILYTPIISSHFTHEVGHIFMTHSHSQPHYLSPTLTLSLSHPHFLPHSHYFLPLRFVDSAATGNWTVFRDCIAHGQDLTGKYVCTCSCIEISDDEGLCLFWVCTLFYRILIYFLDVIIIFALFCRSRSISIAYTLCLRIYVLTFTLPLIFTQYLSLAVHSILGYTALHAAVEFSVKEMILELCALGVPVNIRDFKKGQTPLHYAGVCVCEGERECVCGCVCMCLWECVSVCVCERECVCVCVCESVLCCVCVSGWEREVVGLRICVSVKLRELYWFLFHNCI